MATKHCYICDDPIYKGEPRMVISGMVVHEYCAPEVDGAVCETDGCQWRWCVHAGDCCV